MNRKIKHRVNFFLVTFIIVYLLPVVSCADIGKNLTNSKSHYIEEVLRLKKSGSLIFQSAFNSEQSIENHYPRRKVPQIVFDEKFSAAKFKVGGGILIVTFKPQTAGTLYLQIESRFDSTWCKIDRTDGRFVNGKFIRVRQDKIKKIGAAEPRCFDFQIRMNKYSNSDNSFGIVGLPTIRAYASKPIGGSDPLHFKRDLQPGGIEKSFFYKQGVWIRETYEIDLDSGRIRAWKSDENNETQLIIADPLSDKIGFPYNPTHAFVGISNIRLGINSSSGYPKKGEIFYWHRNLIVATSPINF